VSELLAVNYQEQAASTTLLSAASLSGVAPKRSHPDPALADAIRRLRTERGLSQEDLAHEARITTAALARIERGQANPSWTTVVGIAAGLQVSLRELVAAVETAGRRR
jgi:DNA-binding XRE family transcriptional regulator